MKLIAGLGNPGPNYEQTPHNLGFQVVDRLAERLKIRTRLAGPLSALMGKGNLAGEEVILLKPQTFMNLSGRSIAPLVSQHRLRGDDILVIVDDADLPFGAMRFRRKGGDGGHRGLRSIIGELENDAFVRLRIGVSPDPRPADLESYVLEPFDAERKRWAELIADKAAEAIECAIFQGLDKASNKYNALRIENPIAKATP